MVAYALVRPRRWFESSPITRRSARRIRFPGASSAVGHTGKRGRRVLHVVTALIHRFWLQIGRMFAVVTLIARLTVVVDDGAVDHRTEVTILIIDDSLIGIDGDVD